MSFARFLPQLPMCCDTWKKAPFACFLNQCDFCKIVVPYEMMKNSINFLKIFAQNHKTSITSLTYNARLFRETSKKENKTNCAQPKKKKEQM